MTTIPRIKTGHSNCSGGFDLLCHIYTRRVTDNIQVLCTPDLTSLLGQERSKVKKGPDHVLRSTVLSSRGSRCAALSIFAGSACAQQGTFIPTGSISTGRAAHTATLLNNGKVLIAGGYSSSSNNSGRIDSAELYDPTARSLPEVA